jgi:UDP:flavonoid glycosyltransferase YjiC (YdhE family)
VSAGAERMGSVAWIVGPALGHAARALLVARELRALGITSSFFGADRHGFHARLLAPEFETIDSGHGPKQFEDFADAAVAHLHARQADAVCFDCASVPWRVAMPPLGVPSVYLTNAYLAYPGEPTHQDMQWAEHGAEWNARRIARGLPPLAGAGALLEADRVLFADPEWTLPQGFELPSHQRLTGACAWSPEAPLPAALAGLRDVALVATGSTGGALPPGLTAALGRACGARHVVQVDSRGVRVDDAPPLDVGMLSIPALLPHCRVALTHGGAGSTFQALAQGVPVVVWPGHRNHRLLGTCVQDAGLGLLLHPQDWQRKLATLEHDYAAFAERARAQAFDLARGPREAAKAIAELCAPAPR